MIAPAFTPPGGMPVEEIKKHMLDSIRFTQRLYVVRRMLSVLTWACFGVSFSYHVWLGRPTLAWWFMLAAFTFMFVQTLIYTYLMSDLIKTTGMALGEVQQRVRNALAATPRTSAEFLREATRDRPLA